MGEIGPRNYGALSLGRANDLRSLAGRRTVDRRLFLLISLVLTRQFFSIVVISVPIANVVAGTRYKIRIGLIVIL